MPRPILPDEIEDYRDQRWRRDGEGQVQSAVQAERFIEEVGFAACFSDSLRPGPSLYVAVCGRREAVMPRNVQKDPESAHTWTLKDELLRRGRIYYAKMARGNAMFLAPRMIAYFRGIWRIPRRQEERFSKNALAILRVLRKEWEMGTADLRAESGIPDRKTFGLALDELQAAMIVDSHRSRLPAEVDLPLGTCGRAIPGRIVTKSQPPGCPEGTRTLLSERRRT